MTDIERIVKIIENYSPELAAEEILRLFSVVWRSEQLACDCDRQPLRYNELGTCNYCGKPKPSEV